MAGEQKFLGEGEGAVLDNKVKNLVDRVNRCQIEETAAIAEIKKSIDNLYDKIDKITESLQNRLPLWASILFVVMGSTITGLVVKLVSN